MSKRATLLLMGMALFLSSCDGPLFGSPDISASPEACLFQAEDSNAEIMILCDGKWTASLGHGSWAKMAGASGKGNGTLRLDYGFNGNWSSRTDSLILHSGKKITYVPLVQQGLESLFSVKELNIKGTDATGFTATLPSEWEASCSAGWLKVSPLRGNASSNIRFSVYPLSECLDSESRSCELIFSFGGRNVSIKVTQGKTEKILLENGSRSVGCEGGLVEINVSSNMDYSVFLDASCSGWIEQVETKAFASSVVTLKVMPNRTPQERTGMVTLGKGTAKETFAIIQDAWNAVAESDAYGLYRGTDGLFTYDIYAHQISVIEGPGGFSCRIFRPSDGRFLTVDGLRPQMEAGMPLRLAVVQNVSSSLPYRKTESFRVVKASAEKVWLTSDDGTGLIIPQI